MFSSNIERALKEFIHFSNQYEEKNFLEMKETIKSETDEENVNEYINKYLKSRHLKKEDLKRREHTTQKEDLIQQLKKRSNLSNKEDNYFNWSKSGNGKKSVKRTVPLTIPLTILPGRPRIGVWNWWLKSK